MVPTLHLCVFNDTATTEIYTLSLHDALPIFKPGVVGQQDGDALALPHRPCLVDAVPDRERHPDRKSTRLNSSHANISYAVFCLKKKHKIGKNELHAAMVSRRRCGVYG